jgi:hypothetical protein
MYIKKRHINLLVFLFANAIIFYLFIENLFQPGNGDETFYLKEIMRINEIGLLGLFKEGTSYLFVSVAYLFSLLGFEPLTVLRFISFSSYGMLLLVLYYFLEPKNRMSKINQISIAHLIYPGMISGINDHFLYLFVIFSYLLYFWKNKLRYHTLLTLITIGISFWIRKTAIIYCGPLIILIFFNLIKNKEYLHIAYFFILLFIVMMPHLPALSEGSFIKYENKSKYTGFNWSKSNYLSKHFRIKRGIISYGKVSEDMVEEYEKIHGMNSIPQGLIERWKFDPKFEADNFFSHIVRIIQLFIIMSGGFFIIWCYKIYTSGLKIPLFEVATIVFPLILLSLSVVNYIEARWFFPIAIGQIISVNNLTRRKKIIITVVTIILLFFGFLKVIK